jgi:hypothetical protein
MSGPTASARFRAASLRPRPAPQRWARLVAALGAQPKAHADMDAEAFVLGRRRAAFAALEARLVLVGEKRRLRAASVVDALGLEGRSSPLSALTGLRRAKCPRKNNGSRTMWDGNKPRRLGVPPA